MNGTPTGNVRRYQVFSYTIGLTGWLLLVLGGVWGIRESGLPGAGLGMVQILVGVLLIATGSILYVLLEVFRVTRPDKIIEFSGANLTAFSIGGAGWLIIVAAPIISALLERYRSIPVVVSGVIIGSAMVILGAAVFGLRKVRLLADAPPRLSFWEKFWLELAGLGWLLFLVIPIHGFLTRSIGGMPYFYGGLIGGMGLFLLGTGAYLFLTLRANLDEFFRNLFAKRRT